MSKAAALGWALGPGKRSERRSRQNAFCPNGMRCTIFIISNLKWYYIGERSRLDKRFILVLYAALLAEVFSLQV